MLAHGFESADLAALGFGGVGALVGLWSVVRGLRGVRGAGSRGCVAILCAALVLAVPLLEYYDGLRGYDSEDLGGYDTPAAALDYVDNDRGYGCFCFPAALLGIIGVIIAALQPDGSEATVTTQADAADDASHRS